MSRLFWIIIAALGAGLILLVVNDESGNTFGLPNDDFARLLYLGVWGAVLLPAVLFSSIRLGELARNLAIWLFVALLLVAGYQYRYELQDVASRVTAGLIPGSPLSVTADGRAAVMLEKAPSGHFEVRAEVNGREIPFMLDTGATTTVLTSTDAARAGIDTAALRFDSPVMTANGQAFAAPAVAGSIRIGAISRSRLPVLVAQPGSLQVSLLGMNFLGTLSGMDIRGDRLILRD